MRLFSEERLMKRSEYNLAQWLEWMENNHPTEIDLGLARVGEVYQRMQLDLSASHIISIAGTNGKGSTTALLESIYGAQGYTTLAYTSPHMLHYNERVRLNGGDVSDALLVEAFQAIDKAMGEGDLRITLSYFEIGTLAAFYLVAKEQPKVALLEVGLGGRLDAVNVVDADLAVITTLAVDHVDWLGDDIEQIGLEKAGIARAHKPLICGELNPPKSIAKFAKDNQIDLFQVNEAFSHTLDAQNQHWQFTGVDQHGKQVVLSQLPVPELPLQNAVTALQVVSKMALACSEQSIITGLKNAKALGRQQRVDYQGVNVLLDVAHNPQSAEYLAKSLIAKGLKGNVQLVLGVLADKDCAGLVEHLKPLVSHWHLVTLDVYRGQSAEDLALVLAEQGVVESNISCHQQMQDALVAGCKQLSEGQQVVVAGSFVTVTQALALT